MSGNTVFFRGVVLTLLVAVGALALPSAVRADILEDFKKDRALAAQKLEKEVEQALVEVQKLKTKEPATAMGILNTYKEILEKDTFLTKTRRDQLLAVVTQQVQALQGAAAAQEKIKGSVPKQKSTYQEEYAKYSQYAPKAPPPNSPYGTANKFINDINSKVNTAKQIEYQKGQNTTNILNSIDLGDIPSNGYVSLPKDWKAKTDLRLTLAGLKLTQQEASLMKAMNSVLSVDFSKMPFKDAIEYLSERTGQTILIDPNAMNELMLDYSTPVSLKANKITFRTALKKVLGDVGLAYILKDGIVQVVTPQVARETMTVRSYYVADLLPTPTPGFGPFFNEAREQYFANQIMQMIVMTVEPHSWAVNGTGLGTIWYNPATKSIVVRNNAELHLSLKASMAGGY